VLKVRSPHRKSTKRFLAAVFIAGPLSSLVPVGPSLPASLYYYKGPTKAPNERVCLSFARDQARRHSLHNIKQDNLGVGGTRDGLFAVLTCVGNVVVVMVAGDDGANGAPLGKELFDAVRLETCFDSC
jgi:hypothetical protein